MSNIELENKEKSSFLDGIKRSFFGRWKDLLIITAVALVLLFAVWKVFYKDGEKSESVVFQGTEAEMKVSRLLEEIEGVGEAEVVVCESEDGVVSAVVVCEGANNLRVVMNVREAVAAALGTEEKAVKIYLKKD